MGQKSRSPNNIKSGSKSRSRIKFLNRSSINFESGEWGTYYSSQTDDINEFKMYCIENVIDKYDDDDNKMVNDLMSGTFMGKFLKTFY